MKVLPSFSAGSTPIGSLFAGALASTWGAPAAIGVGRALGALTGVAGLFWLRRIRGARVSLDIRAAGA